MAKPGMDANDGRMRAVIERVTPSVDGGRFAAKRIVGEDVVMNATTLPAVRMPNRDGFVSDPRPDVPPGR